MAARYSLLLLTFVFLFMPSAFVGAQGFNAGVVNGVWFSPRTFFAGTPAHLHVAVQNCENKAIDGIVAFLVNGELVGTTNFSHAPSAVGTCSASVVSLPYTFTKKTHSVSAYIASSNQNAVVYTTLPAVSIDVAEDPNETTTTPTTKTASSSINTTNSNTTIINNITNAGTSVAANANPVIENTATTIENFRDSVIGFTPTTGSETLAVNTQDSESAETNNKVRTGRISTPRNLFDVSLEIAQSDATPAWRKVIGVFLSLGALLLRYWWIWAVLLFVYILYRLLRRVFRRSRY